MVLTKLASLLIVASLLFSPSVENSVVHSGEENSTTTPVATTHDEDAYLLAVSTRAGHIMQDIGYEIINELPLTPVEFRAVAKLNNAQLTIGLQNPGNYSKDEFLSKWSDTLKQATDDYNKTEGVEPITLDEVMQGYYFTMIRFEGTSSSMKNNMEKIMRFEKKLKDTVADVKVSIGAKKDLEDALKKVREQSD